MQSCRRNSTQLQAALLHQRQLSSAAVTFSLLSKSLRGLIAICWCGSVRQPPTDHTENMKLGGDTVRGCQNLSVAIDACIVVDKLWQLAQKPAPADTGSFGVWQNGVVAMAAARYRTASALAQTSFQLRDRAIVGRAGRYGSLIVRHQSGRRRSVHFACKHAFRAAAICLD